MSGSSIDLFRYHFWLAFALAVMILTPLRQATWRRWFFAGVNLFFVQLIVRHAFHQMSDPHFPGFSGLVGFLLRYPALGVVGFCLLAVFLLRNLPKSPKLLGWLPLLLAAGLGLMALHKLPRLTDSARLCTAQELLSAIGFSYLFLRLVDLFREVGNGRLAAPDLADAINYLVPFHMLAAGPIQSYADFVARSPMPETLTVGVTLQGLERIAWGLFKKFVLAFAVQSIFLTDFQAQGPYLFVEAQLFFVWLYLDFSAYSDIAVGTGRLIGVATPENFNHPLLARNLIDFWERWHITLSQFIRRHLFIPVQLGLARRALGRPLLCAGCAFAISFVVCGLWHGLTIRCFFWGLLHAAGVLVAYGYRDALGRRLDRTGMKAYQENRLIRATMTCLTFEFVAFSLFLLQYHW